MILPLADAADAAATMQDDQDPNQSAAVASTPVRSRKLDEHRNDNYEKDTQQPPIVTPPRTTPHKRPKVTQEELEEDPKDEDNVADDDAVDEGTEEGEEEEGDDKKGVDKAADGVDYDDDGNAETAFPAKDPPTVKLTVEQLAILESCPPPILIPAKKGQLIRVTAAAGSGKTTTLIHLALKAYERGHRSITYLTFGCAAAKDG
jgi:flagellar biosynthesis GTPase FlhF